MACNNNKFNRIREPSSKKKLLISLFKKGLLRKFRKGIHQIQKLLVLTLVYHLLGNESLQAVYSAAVGPVIEISRGV